MQGYESEALQPRGPIYLLKSIFLLVDWYINLYGNYLAFGCLVDLDLMFVGRRATKDKLSYFVEGQA